MPVTLDEDIWYHVAHYIEPNPVDFARLATVSKAFYKVFTGDAVWKLLNPYGVDGNIYQTFREKASPKDLEAMVLIWKYRYNPDVPLQYDLFTNLYLHVGYLTCTPQGAPNGPPKLDNKHLVLTCLGLDDYVYFLEDLVDNLYLDRDIAVAACRQHGCMLEFFPKFQDDKELAFLTVTAGCPDEDTPLKFVSEELRDDYDVVMAAVKHDGHSLEHASERLRSDKSVIEAAAQVEPFALRGALDVDRDMVLKHIPRCQYLLEELSDEFRDDREIVTVAVKANWRSIYGASDNLAQDQQMLRMMVKLHPECLETLKKESYGGFGNGCKVRAALEKYKLL